MKHIPSTKPPARHVRDVSSAVVDGWAAGRRTAQVLRWMNQNLKVVHLALTRVLRVTILCSVQSHLPAKIFNDTHAVCAFA